MGGGGGYPTILSVTLIVRPDHSAVCWVQISLCGVHQSARKVAVSAVWWHCGSLRYRERSCSRSAAISAGIFSAISAGRGNSQNCQIISRTQFLLQRGKLILMNGTCTGNVTLLNPHFYNDYSKRYNKRKVSNSIFCLQISWVSAAVIKHPELGWIDRHSGALHPAGGSWWQWDTNMLTTK